MVISLTSAKAILFDMKVMGAVERWMPSHYGSDGCFDDSGLRYFPRHYYLPIGGYHLCWIRPYWVDEWGVDTRVPSYLITDEWGRVVFKTPLSEVFK